MSGSLIIYSSKSGHTKAICENIKNLLENKELIKVIDLDDATSLNLSEFDKIVIGASIRYGRHNKKVLKFVKKNKYILHLKKTAFFSVNVVARKKEKSLPNNNPYVLKFLEKTNWKPNKVAVFAGKVDYPNYNFLDKYIIKLIMFITSGPVDTSQSYEFTDWSKVEDFAKEIN